MATYVSHGLIQLIVMARAILRPHRDPASRIAWVLVVAAVPVVGIAAYLLFGETSIGRKRAARALRVLGEQPDVAQVEAADHNNAQVAVPAHREPLFRLGKSINGFAPLGGNRARLMADSNAGIDFMVADIDAAQDHVHLIFYIWLADNNGLKVAAALKRAAARGVACRAMADSLGSRAMIHSKHWREMNDAGVKLGVALPIGNPFLRPFLGRIDLRNHRKIVVIDDAITYCGSQNCADPEFLVKKKYAPWVDMLVRFEGPIARQNQHVFAGDWMAYVDEDITDLLRMPLRASQEGFTAQVIAVGPTVRNSAMPEVFETLMHSARERLVISTPYYVPNESMQAALCAAAHRGVDTTIILPARNDSWEVAAASRSYYRELLKAGVTIFEFVGGLLHSKSMTVDDDVTLIGSANMDRRSFDLNYENNILVCDEELSASCRSRQEEYIAASRQVRLADVDQWSTLHVLWNNFAGMLSPLL